MSDKPTLYVDLDGTLTRSDVSYESLLQLLKHNLFYLALIPFWFLKGLAHLKAEIARRVDIPIRLLPLNPEGGLAALATGVIHHHSSTT